MSNSKLKLVLEHTSDGSGQGHAKTYYKYISTARLPFLKPRYAGYTKTK